MDFYKVTHAASKKGSIDVFPVFQVAKSRDLMVRGRSFYAVWDEERKLWSTNEYDVARMIDADLSAYAEKLEATTSDAVHVKYMHNYNSRTWSEYQDYVRHLSDNAVELDSKIIFSDMPTVKEDYASKKLPYPLGETSEAPSYDRLMSVLYSKEEREKIEWAIGSVFTGDSKRIQKFLVFYGEAGTGKSTVLNIIQQLFEGYYTTFDAKSLTSSSNAFATEVFKGNPLVAIQHDGDLSRIEDNAKLNSIVSHEEMTLNEKYKPSYTAAINCFLFMASNRPVKITDAKSGIIRRLIDVRPTGAKLPAEEYLSLMDRIPFELGAIARRCIAVFKAGGRNRYISYRPLDMMLKTDVFYNFVEDNFFEFKECEGITLKRAYDLYKDYCAETGLEYAMPRYKFREELKNYFSGFEDRIRIDGTQTRSYYTGFLEDKFVMDTSVAHNVPNPLVLDKKVSLLDDILKDCPAQYATRSHKPSKAWDAVDTRLSDLDTHRVHYIRVPQNHIVIDFDLKDEEGNKSKELNLEAASKWPPTYAEFSKGGAGVHLHYIYTGDVSKLSRVYSEGIEIKVFSGKSSLRRRLSYCNDIPVASLSSGLPVRKEEKMINADSVKTESKLRELIVRNLNKEIHPGTKPSVDFIYKILDDAYNSDLSYDVSDMYTKVLAFANNSTHHSRYCVSLVNKMRFKSETESAPADGPYSDGRIAFYDIEVYPNLLLVCWKFQGDSSSVVPMVNPTSEEVERLMELKLVGFNNRRYDNHILYARYLGYDNEQIFRLSQKIISGDRNAFFREAYNLSYTDIYDFSTKKQSLKKFEIELGIHHQELNFPWDEPVPEDQWPTVISYCTNDVLATEAVFEARKADFLAREILADISGLTVGHTTQQHTARILFGDDKHPQDKFKYTDLSELFPGYTYSYGKSSYRGEDPSEGGYVYAEPGMYGNVALLDIASMHPTSIELLNAFGPYTKRFSELKEARLAVKHKDIQKAKTLLGGVLAKYLDDETQLDALAYALKISINIVYGLTSAKFDNPFRDPRNVDNIVAKRGALFMIELKHAVQEHGYTVAHIKTDSIKIPDATPEIIEFVMAFGKKYGYTFEHEATYEKMCLVNDAVYIAKVKGVSEHGGWTATGAQFAQPYVFKTLFSKERLTFADYTETKTVTSALYLDCNEGYPDVSEYEEVARLRQSKAKKTKRQEEILDSFKDVSDEQLSEMISEGHNYVFVGKAGSFCPVEPGAKGGLLVRKADDRYFAVTGTKGHRWLESEMVEALGLAEKIDKSYHKELVDEAVADISKYGDFEWFVSDDPYVSPEHV